jgi:hypothetical protein
MQRSDYDFDVITGPSTPPPPPAQPATEAPRGQDRQTPDSTPHG